LQCFSLQVDVSEIIVHEADEPNGVVDRGSLASIEMPNRAGFVSDPRPDTQSTEPCMKDCKAKVEVLFKAKPLAVTPEGETE